MHDEVKIGTLRSIADQCGAEDFQEWCRWIDDYARRSPSVVPKA